MQTNSIIYIKPQVFLLLNRCWDDSDKQTAQMVKHEAAVPWNSNPGPAANTQHQHLKLKC